MLPSPPNQAQPGDTISLSATDMKPYAEADYVKVGGTAYNDPGANTDIDGNITIDDVLVPGLDPGTYSVIINVDGTVAIGELEVLAEGSAAGQSGARIARARVETVGRRAWCACSTSTAWTKPGSFFDPQARVRGPEHADQHSQWPALLDSRFRRTWKNVLLNNKTRNLTCVGGDCWNQIVW